VPYGIRVNTVSPGSILVRLTSPGYFEDYVRHGFPMGRLGTAEEVADVIVFLASPRAHGSTAETFRWMAWSSRTPHSTAGRTRYRRLLASWDYRLRRLYQGCGLPCTLARSV
jgi:Enoyl-(Acyl carrier protein) reductase